MHGQLFDSLAIPMRNAWRMAAGASLDRCRRHRDAASVPVRRWNQQLTGSLGQAQPVWERGGSRRPLLRFATLRFDARLAPTSELPAWIAPSPSSRSARSEDPGGRPRPARLLPELGMEGCACRSRRAGGRRGQGVLSNLSLPLEGPLASHWPPGRPGDPWSASFGAPGRRRAVSQILAPPVAG